MVDAKIMYFGPTTICFRQGKIWCYRGNYMMVKNLPLIVILITGLVVPLVRTAYSQVLTPEQKKRLAGELEGELKGLDLAERLKGQATMLFLQGDYLGAVEKLKQALNIIQKASGPYSSEASVIMQHISEAYKESGRYDLAIKYCTDVVGINKKIHGPNSRAVAGALSHLSDLYRGTDNDTQAERYKKEALAIYERILDPNTPSDRSYLEAHYNSMAIFYRSRGRINDAEEFEERAKKVRLNQKR